MRKVVSLIIGLISLSASAQVQLTPYVVGEVADKYKSAESVLTQRLHAAISGAGCNSAQGSRFVMAAKADVIQQEVVPVTPPLHQLHLQISLGIGDGMDGKCYGTRVIEVKGQGQSVERAYLNALKSIKPSDPQIKQLCREATQGIIEYYDKNGNAIIADAVKCANNNDFDQALYILSAIPMESSTYAKASATMDKVLSQSINYNADAVLSEAEAMWASNPSEANAERIMSMLSDIEPNTNAFTRAKALIAKVESKILSDRAEERADRNAELARQHKLESARINAARDVAVAYAKNQPKVVYNTRIVHWW